MSYISRFLLAFGWATVLGSAASPALAEQVSSEVIICRAALAALMGKDVKSVTVTRIADSVVYTEYVQAGGKRWNQRCKLVGNRVVWAYGNARWRESANDSTWVTYTIDPNGITIKQVTRDGSFNTRQFELEALD